MLRHFGGVSIRDSRRVDQCGTDIDGNRDLQRLDDIFAAAPVSLPVVPVV
jgi:hypothetical protein